MTTRYIRKTCLVPLVTLFFVGAAFLPSGISWAAEGAGDTVGGAMDRHLLDGKVRFG